MSRCVGYRRSSLALAALVLGACAATKPEALDIPYDNLAFAQANPEGGTLPAVGAPPAAGAPPTVVITKPLPLPGQLKPRPQRGAKEAAVLPNETIATANAAARIEPSKGGYINAIQVYPFTQGALYRLYAAPEKVSTVALEAGEELIDVSSGDTVRWVIGDTLSGDGHGSKRVHILIKPTAAELSTNLVILTDRRTYHLELQSTKDTYMASVSWTYPADSLIALHRMNGPPTAEEMHNDPRALPPESLHFRYRIEGDTPPWRPLRAFDDGRKVFIEMPQGLAQGEAPPLFVAGSDGQPELVNYRLHGNYYIVDRLFAVAELRLGEAPQRIVRIVRTDARPRDMRADEVR
jgi:type IV secretion system protein TrbG